MKKIQINGVEFNDFGINNYSNGMHLISYYPMRINMVLDVLTGKYPGVYLNPSAPCHDEFFGVFGTEEQYKEFKKRQEEAQISSSIIDKAGGFDAFQKLSPERYHEIETEIRSTYKNWWESIIIMKIAELYIDFNLSKEEVMKLFNKYNLPYKRFEDLPEEFHEVAEIHKVDVYIRERGDEDILEELLMAGE